MNQKVLKGYIRSRRLESLVVTKPLGDSLKCTYAVRKDLITFLTDHEKTACSNQFRSAQFFLFKNHTYLAHF